MQYNHCGSYDHAVLNLQLQDFHQSLATICVAVTIHKAITGYIFSRLSYFGEISTRRISPINKKNILFTTTGGEGILNTLLR